MRLAAVFFMSLTPFLFGCATVEKAQNQLAKIPGHLESAKDALGVERRDWPDAAAGLLAYQLLKPSGGELILTGLAYIIVDPMSPNWHIEETRLGEDTFYLRATLKRHNRGGEGEAARLFQRRAEQLLREFGYSSYLLLNYSEGIESRYTGAERYGEGRVQLVRQYADSSAKPAERPARPAGRSAEPPADRQDDRSRNARITLSADALFDFDKAVLRPEGKVRLDDIAAIGREINLEIGIAVGHTDRLGSEAYNQRLSEQRAAAVKQYLVSKGIKADRVFAEGRGKREPVTGDACNNMGAENSRNKELIECLQPDRRVEVELSGTNP
jgi:outer membrane protein OmpA-like peptidoglycan-associated protein